IAVAIELNGYGTRRAGGDKALEILKPTNVITVDGNDDIAWLETGRLGDGACNHFADNGGNGVAAIAQQQRVKDEEGQYDVGDRPRGNYSDALPDILVGKEPRRQ